MGNIIDSVISFLDSVTGTQQCLCSPAGWTVHSGIPVCNHGQQQLCGVCQWGRVWYYFNGNGFEEAVHESYGQPFGELDIFPSRLVPG